MKQSDSNSGSSQGISAEQLAKITGLSPRELRNLVGDGVISSAKSGRYDIGVLPALIRHFIAESQTLPRYQNMRAASGATGIPVGEFKQAKQAGCNAFDDQGKIRLGDFLRWRFSEGNESLKTVESVTISLREKQCENLEIKNSILRADSIPVDEVVSFVMSLYQEDERMTRGFLAKIPERFAGKSIAAMRICCDEFDSELCSAKKLIMAEKTKEWEDRKLNARLETKADNDLDEPETE